MRPVPGLILRDRSLPSFLLALSLLAGCGLIERSSPELDRSQDSRIQAEVQSRLTREPSLDAANIRVAVEGRVVLLHGSVRGLGAWQCAVTTSGLVQGVRTVVDYLVIERGPRDVTCIAPRPDSALVAGGP